MKGERCAYCGGPIVEKKVDLSRTVKGKYVLIETVPAEVCTECGMRYYAAKALKSIEETIRGRGGQSGKSLFQCTRCDGARHVVVAFGMRRALARLKRWVPIEQVRVINA